MTFKSEPTLVPASDFDGKEDAKALRTAMKGSGSDNTVILGVLTKRTNAQRQKIISAYSHEFDRNLLRDLQSELDGKFEDLILALLDPPGLYMAKLLHGAMEGIGTNEPVLNSILCTQTNEELKAIRLAYEQKYGKPLEKAVKSEVSGDYKKLLEAILTAQRDEQVFPSRAHDQAKDLYKAGEKRFGTDEKTFINILSQASFDQIKLIMKEYKKVSKNSLSKAIKSEFSGCIVDALLTILKFSKNRARYFARQLELSLSGLLLKDEHTVARIIVSRCEIDLGAIKREYQDKYKKKLYTVIMAESQEVFNLQGGVKVYHVVNAKLPKVYDRQYSHIHKVALLKLVGED